MSKGFDKFYHDAQIRTRVSVGPSTLESVHIELKPDTRRPDAIQYAARGFTNKPPLTNPGGFDVYVNGAHWGRTYPEGKGVHGSIHYVCQMQTSGHCHRACVEVPRDINPRFNLKPTRSQEFFEWSDKRYIRQGGKVPAPLPERIADKVAEAIRAGALRDPAVVAAEAAVASKMAREQEAARLQRERGEWEAKAMDAIGTAAFTLTPGGVADLKARIVEAMKWAQRN